MNTLRQLFFIGLASILVLPSCTTEKRLYMTNNHIEWKGQNNYPDKQKLVNNDKKTEQNQVVPNENTEIALNTFANSFESTITEHNITASVDNFPILLSHKTISLSPMDYIINDNAKPISETKIVISNKKELKNKVKELSKSSSDDGALRAIGWVVLILGLLILLLVSMIIGALLMLLGLIFVLAGAKKSTSPQSNNKNENSQYVDVVYLNNGSIIKGMIIEQTPNVSLKIQTKDGNTFVYKMDEVLKITKELAK